MCVTIWGGFLFPFSPFKMETLHYACCLSIHRGGFRAQLGGPETRKNNEGQAHVGANSAASDPQPLCVWRMFPECRFYRLCCIFSIIFSAAENHRGQSQEQNRWAEDPVVLHMTVRGQRRI